VHTPQRADPASSVSAPGAHGVARRRARRPRLACLGDLTLDVVIRSEQPLASGTDVPGTVVLRAGGSAANTARAFAALGGEATFIGAVGDDGLGRRLVAAVRADGVRVHAPTVRRATARLAAIVDRSGERSFVTARGAADGLRASHLRGAWLTRVDALHLPAYSLLGEPLASATKAAISHARGADRLVSVDLASRGPLLARGRGAARALLAEADPDVLLGNADEARALVGGATERLLELAPLVVVKEGAAGCRVLWRAADNGSVLQLAVATARVEAADTTGAGDAFNAGFLHALIEQTTRGAARRSPGEATSLDRTHGLRRAEVLRRAAIAGHRSAAAWVRRSQPALEL
jgi:sugar/nucleoside kinase (ribokinase family)